MLSALLSRARCGEHVCCGKNVCCRMKLCWGRVFAAELIAVASGGLLWEILCSGNMLAFANRVAGQIIVLIASEHNCCGNRMCLEMLFAVGKLFAVWECVPRGNIAAGTRLLQEICARENICWGKFCSGIKICCGG